MKKPQKRKPLVGDDKVVSGVVRGRTAADWRRLLRDEDGPELHHLLSALNLYIEKMGYTSKPKSPTA